MSLKIDTPVPSVQRTTTSQKDFVDLVNSSPSAVHTASLIEHQIQENVSLYVKKLEPFKTKVIDKLERASKIIDTGIREKTLASFDSWLNESISEAEASVEELERLAGLYKSKNAKVGNYKSKKRQTDELIRTLKDLKTLEGEISSSLGTLTPGTPKTPEPHRNPISPSGIHGGLSDTSNRLDVSAISGNTSSGDLRTPGASFQSTPRTYGSAVTPSRSRSSVTSNRRHRYSRSTSPGPGTVTRIQGGIPPFNYNGDSVVSADSGAQTTPVATALPTAAVVPADLVGPAATVDAAGGGEAKRLQSVVDNVGAMENFMIGKSVKQLYYMPVPMKTALEKAEKSDMLRVINKTIREYGAVIGITECTVDMQNSHSELASYYDILVHRVKGWADGVATLNDPDTPLWKYNPDVLLERRVAYDTGLAEFQKQLHKDGVDMGVDMGADAQRSPNELNRIAADKMMVAKRKFEKVTRSDRLKSDNSEAGNRRLAHMFLKSVPPLHMFKKDLAPTSHMSQAPQSQRKMRKVVHNPLQMGPPIVIEFTNVMMKTTHDSDEEY